MKTVLVCGSRGCVGRTYAKGLFKYLDDLLAQGPFVLIHGGAKGADRLGASWGELRKVKVIEYPALWVSNGRMAGLVRNRQMVDTLVPGRDLVVALWDGKSVGTKHTMGLAREKCVEVVVLRDLAAEAEVGR